MFLIGEHYSNNAPGICHILDSNQVPLVRVEPIATTCHDCVWLRQARGRSSREIDWGNAGGDCNVKLTLRRESDAVCTWERTLGSEWRERFLEQLFSERAFRLPSRWRKWFRRWQQLDR